MRTYLDFEKPVAELEAKVEELRALEQSAGSVEIGEEITRIEGKAAEALRELYANLPPWQKAQVARHPQRPHCVDYIASLISDFTPLAGDRKFGEDEAIIGGLADRVFPSQSSRHRPSCPENEPSTQDARSSLTDSRHGSQERSCDRGRAINS